MMRQISYILRNVQLREVERAEIEIQNCYAETGVVTPPRRQDESPESPTAGSFPREDASVPRSPDQDAGVTGVPQPLFLP